MLMRRIKSLLHALALLLPLAAAAQIDPVKRDLFQFGYNQPLEGRAPVAGYAYFYHNQPDFLRTNLTLRVALAPVYLDSELGFNHLLGPNTDFAIGAAGGGDRRGVAGLGFASRGCSDGRSFATFAPCTP